VQTGHPQSNDPEKLPETDGPENHNAQDHEQPGCPQGRLPEELPETGRAQSHNPQAHEQSAVAKSHLAENDTGRPQGDKPAELETLEQFPAQNPSLVTAVE
jgi:hypothetical protein